MLDMTGVTRTARVLDGEQLDVQPGTFDAVISRVGFIYFTTATLSRKESASIASVPRPRRST